MLTLTMSARARIRVIRPGTPPGRGMIDGPAVRVDEQQHVVREAATSAVERRGDRLQDEAQRPGVHRARRRGQPAREPGRTARGRRPVRVEAVRAPRPTRPAPRGRASWAGPCAGRGRGRRRRRCRPASRSRPNRSDDSPPIQATGTPSRPTARAALYGPPPGTAAIVAVGAQDEVDERLARDDDRGVRPRSGARRSSSRGRRRSTPGAARAVVEPVEAAVRTSRGRRDEALDGLRGGLLGGRAQVGRDAPEVERRRRPCARRAPARAPCGARSGC